MCVGGLGYFAFQSSKHQVENAHNPLVCIFRKYVKQSRARSEFVSKHGPTAQGRATAAQAVTSADEVLLNLITIPPSRGCDRVLKP